MLKQLFFLAALLFLPFQTVYGQALYTHRYVANGGYPNNTRTGVLTSTVGWTQILPPNLAANQWSSVRNLPFAFSFFGAPVTQFKVSANLLLTFDPAATRLPSANASLPAATLPDKTIAVFWDEFSSLPPIGSNDVVVTRTFGTAPRRQHWIMWASYEYGNPAVSYSFNACVLEETTNKIYIVDQYSSDLQLTSTVGLQRDAATAVMAGNGQTPLGGNFLDDTQDTDLDYYEFQPVPTGADPAIVGFINPSGCLAATEPVEVKVENRGSVSSVSATVQVKVSGNGQTQTLDGTVSGVLAPGSSQNVVLGTVNMNAPGTYVVEARINGVADADTANSRLRQIFVNRPVQMSSIPIVTFTGFTGTNLPAIAPDWSEAQGRKLPTGTASNWTASSTDQAAALGSATAQIFMHSRFNNEWLVSAPFIAQTGTQFTFRAAITDMLPNSSSLMGFDDSVQVKIKTDCGTTYRSLFSFNRTNTPSSILSPYQINLSAFAGQRIAVAIFASDGATQDIESYYFHLDEMVIQNNVLPVRYPSVESMISLYPNPSRGQFNLHISGNTAITSFSLYNTLGKRVFWKEIKDSNRAINCLGLSAGTYIARIVMHNGMVITKRVVLL